MLRYEKLLTASHMADHSRAAAGERGTEIQTRIERKREAVGLRVCEPSRQTHPEAARATARTESSRASFGRSPPVKDKVIPRSPIDISPQCCADGKLSRSPEPSEFDGDRIMAFGL